MSQNGLVVSVKNKALSACEGYGVLLFVKRMEMCWFWCNVSLSSYREIQDSSVRQSGQRFPDSGSGYTSRLKEEGQKAVRKERRNVVYIFGKLIGYGFSDRCPLSFELVNVFRRVREIAKSVSLHRICLSCHPHGTTRLPVDGFS
jgi:hypothetical protein